MRSVGREHPLFLARGEGPYVADVDGNRYVDWVMSWGPLIAGHAHPEVVSAVSAAAAARTSFGAPTEAGGGAAAEGGGPGPAGGVGRVTSGGAGASMRGARPAAGGAGRR